MVKENEIEVRTDNNNLLMCTAERKPDGNIELISRHGRKEDRITINAFLSKIYGRSVVITVL